MKPYGAKRTGQIWNRGVRRCLKSGRFCGCVYDAPLCQIKSRRQKHDVPLVRREFVWDGREEYPVSTHFSQHSQAPYQAGQDDWWDDCG